MTFYTDLYVKNGYGYWQSEKTALDPCPYGWKVPDGGEDGIWAKAMNRNDIFNDGSLIVECGLNFSGLLGADEMIYYPAAGSIVDSSFENILYGYYWSSFHHRRDDTSDLCAHQFYFHVSGEVNPTEAVFGYSMGASVRCQKDE